MNPVVWSNEAALNLRQIADYVSDDNPAAALRVTDRILTTAAGLGDVATGRRGRIAGTYEKVVPGLPYLLIYQLGRRREVYILHVVHGARRWPAEPE